MNLVDRAERFKKARTEFNVHGSQTREQVYKDTGIAVSLLEDLENYKKDRQVSYQKIAVLAHYYGVSANYLLGLGNYSIIDDRAQAACEYTGLSETSIMNLHTESFDRNAIDGLNAIFGQDFSTLHRLSICIYRSLRFSEYAKNKKIYKPLTQYVPDDIKDPFFRCIDEWGGELLCPKDAGEFYATQATHIFLNMLENAQAPNNDTFANLDMDSN